MPYHIPSHPVTCVTSCDGFTLTKLSASVSIVSEDTIRTDPVPGFRETLSFFFNKSVKTVNFTVFSFNSKKDCDIEQKEINASTVKFRRDFSGVDGSLRPLDQGSTLSSSSSLSKFDDLFRPFLPPTALPPPTEVV
jgi:hypothetical protein